MPVKERKIHRKVVTQYLVHCWQASSGPQGTAGATGRGARAPICPAVGSLGSAGAGSMLAMDVKSRSGTSSEERSSSMSPMSWKRYAASMSCRGTGTRVAGVAAWHADDRQGSSLQERR